MFFLVVYDKKFPIKTLLKKRFHKKPILPKLKFGESGFTFLRNIRFEFSYFFYIRKFLKRLLKLKKRFFKITKVWIFIRPNHVLTKKSKNSRMGKGKGMHIRWCSLLEKGFVFIEFKNISIFKLKKYYLKLEKRIKIPMKIIVHFDVKPKLLYKNYTGSNIKLPLTPFMY